MNSSSYEEYMQNVLGYRIMPPNTYQMPDNIYEMQPIREHENLEMLYPDIYRMVYPMVQKVCMRASEVINEDMIDSMTEEVYKAMVESETRKSNEMSKVSSEVKGSNIQNVRKQEETRQNNFMLRDLIRILIIRELLRRRRRPGMGRPPMRPPYPREMDFPIM